MNKWTSAFLQEADDLLLRIEEAGLTLEEGGTSEEIIGQLFRAFHTIKGSGAMCGLQRVAEFTHQVENLLDLAREGRVRATPLLGELVLAAADHIRALLSAEEAESGDEVPAAARLQQLLAQFPSDGESAGAGTAAARTTQPRAASTAGSGYGSENEGHGSGDEGSQGAWHIDFRPAEDILRCGGNPLLLLAELRTLGELEVVAHCDRVPGLEALEPLSCQLWWTGILKSDVEQNAVRDVFVFVEDGATLRVHRLGSAGGEVEGGGAGDAPQQRLPAAATQPAGKEAGKEAARESTVRVPASRLDRLVNLVGELTMNQSRLAQAVMSAAAEVQNPVQELERLVAELRENVLGIRMLPIGTIFGRYRRLVHDLSAELKKEVELITEGSETELDKSILDQLGEPLVHLLRNAIDHGIEPAAERERRGKPRRGRLRLRAEHIGSAVVVSLADDGAGIRRSAVRAKAIENGLISAEQVLSDKQLVNLVLLPGFSTAAAVTSVSGRGVGMDVVKRQMDALRASVSVSSEEGRGTEVVLQLPLTLAIIEGLIVAVGEEQFIVPMASITENVELTAAERLGNNRRNVVPVRGELVPYIDLRGEFSMGGAVPAVQKVVIVKHQEERLGLVVDRVLGTHQTVLQPLGNLLRRIAVVSGATILGDGRVALILDIAALVAHTSRGMETLERARGCAGESLRGKDTSGR